MADAIPVNLTWQRGALIFLPIVIAVLWVYLVGWRLIPGARSRGCEIAVRFLEFSGYASLVVALGWSVVVFLSR
jgi:hypothetical protein